MYAELHEIRAFVPPGVPVIATTATVTSSVREDVMKGCEFVTASPNRPNIYYEVHPRTTIEEDFAPLVSALQSQRNKADRIIVYCRSLNMCSDLYLHFHDCLGESSYFPPSAPQLSDNRLFGMFHAGTPVYNKEVILSSLKDSCGVVRIVFATIALGMGVNVAGLNTIWHYGAPQSMDDYFQGSGRAGRTGEPAKSIIFWKPSDVPERKNQKDPRNVEISCMRRYPENTSQCRRYQLLRYFNPELSPPSNRDKLLCCDVCASAVTELNC